MIEIFNYMITIIFLLLSCIFSFALGFLLGYATIGNTFGVDKKSFEILSYSFGVICGLFGVYAFISHYM